ncbi:MAG: transcriptional repressor [Chloroflexota bacterium]|jgi:Fe2+ or Zn2+ uptake regulation protein|nr:transcriptional repressor [Chloroflexota bacterium]MDH5242549.1 transcriptional repressor [Chloroflexota bacterium]
MVETTPLIAALEDAGYRVTGPRRNVVGLIAGRSGHFTAADLVTESNRRRLGVGRATVFRTIEVLSDVGVVERIDLPSGEHAYIACQPVHHHHVVCSGCGRTRDVDDAGLRHVVRDIARQTGYRVDDHRLELFGLCPECQTAASGANRPGPSR